MITSFSPEYDEIDDLLNTLQRLPDYPYYIPSDYSRPHTTNRYSNIDLNYTDKDDENIREFDSIYNTLEKNPTLRISERDIILLKNIIRENNLNIDPKSRMSQLIYQYDEKYRIKSARKYIKDRGKLGLSVTHYKQEYNRLFNVPSSSVIEHTTSEPSQRIPTITSDPSQYSITDEDILFR